ncbi:MAG: hypothetical protein LBO75_03490 [Bifidobacteriaceae bacterium]|jgi:hypothetical protein|nr:hypothetical protein [Bifidobacteriaceae bacterium]
MVGEPPDRKPVLLRLNAPVYDAVARWARDDLRSVNAQIEFLLRRALETAGRAPADPGPLPRRGRPPGSGSGAGPGSSPGLTSDSGGAVGSDAQ